MKLKEYIDKYEDGVESFCSKTKIPYSSIQHYFSGERVPGITRALGIEKYTRGLVTIEDLRGPVVYKETYHSLAEAAEYMHLTSHMTVKKALERGHLKGVQVKKNGRTVAWEIKRTDLDDYMKGKYSEDKREFEGEKIFDLYKGKMSVHRAAIYFKMPSYRIYYLLRTGQLRGKKIGATWVLDTDDLMDLPEIREMREVEKMRSRV